MLISKFDLYKSEWLELVFDDRNKAYGAYELRQHYPRTMVKAMTITFISIVALSVGVGILIKPAVTKADDAVKTTVVDLIHYVKPPEVTPPKPPAHINSPALPHAASTPVAMRQFVPLVVTTDDKAKNDPPKKSELATVAIGPVNVNAKGPSTGVDPGPPTPPVITNGSGVVSDFHELEVMPEPVGGASAWSKFLRKNLRYPDMAIDQHIQGKIWVSFIIEKDGTLSHFSVDRGVGYGLDEEALRVLKLAPAWKPGIQNGQPVRVKYNIPINFQLSDEQ
jgi:periplasmic protein TonB